METVTMGLRQDERTERLTDLQLLRLGAPGKPRQALVAKRMKSQRPTVSQFESGAREATLDFIRKYAKAVGAPTREVERRYWTTRMAYCTEVVRMARAALERLDP